MKQRLKQNIFLQLTLLLTGLILLPLFWGCSPFVAENSGKKGQKNKIAEELKAQDGSDFTEESSEETDDELWRDMYISACMPVILQSVEEYYGIPFSVDPWDISVLKIERTEGYRSFYFRMELEITPYDGPHTAVGKDRLVLESDGTGYIEAVEFSHVESFEMPKQADTLTA